MPESGGIPKPTDIFIGVVDFFAILVPGIVAVIVAGWAAQLRVPEKQDVSFLGVVLVAGYVLGHILYGIGSFLDVLVYDPLFKPLDNPDGAHGFRRRSYFRANDRLYRASKELILQSLHGPGGKHAGPGDSRQLPAGVYQWARAWLRIHSAEATSELDRLEADSKLFRSLTVIALAMLAAWHMLPESSAGYLVLVILAMLLCLWRYCDLRQKMVRAGYLHFLLLRADSATPHHDRQQAAIP